VPHTNIAPNSGARDVFEAALTEQRRDFVRSYRNLEEGQPFLVRFLRFVSPRRTSGEESDAYHSDERTNRNHNRHLHKGGPFTMAGERAELQRKEW